MANRRPTANEGAARELLLALATARSDGDVTTYRRLLTEATTEPARSLVLIDTFVRFLLSIASERTSERTMSREDLLRLLALVVAPGQEDR